MVLKTSMRAAWGGLQEEDQKFLEGKSGDLGGGPPCITRGFLAGNRRVNLAHVVPHRNAAGGGGHLGGIPGLGGGGRGKKALEVRLEPASHVEKGRRG